MSMHPTSLKYDHTTRTVSNGQGASRVLSPQCAHLLELFLTRENHIVTRKQMREVIWRHNIVSEDMINHLICRLRKELRTLPGETCWQIEAIPKVGYRMLLTEQEKHDIKYWLHRCGSWFSGSE